MKMNLKIRRLSWNHIKMNQGSNAMRKSLCYSRKFPILTETETVTEDNCACILGTALNYQILTLVQDQQVQTEYSKYLHF